MADPASYRPAPGTIPTYPGVYRFRDQDGRVIYVGKAINLRQRINSYFGAGLHFRTKTMVHVAASIDWTVVNNELEALQLEHTWIKEFDPRFNVRFRDDKSYPWVAITWSEEFPRVFVGRGARRKGNRYFGPYAQAWAIRQTIDSILRVFPMRSCSKGIFQDARAKKRPCLLGHIGKCAAPCVGRISAEEHRQLVVDVCAFLSGRTRGLETKLEAQMRQAAANLEFEKAAQLRDALTGLRSASEKNAIVLLDGTDADVIAFAEDDLEVAVHIFHVRDGRVRSSRGWVAEKEFVLGPDLVDSFLLQYYAGETDFVADIPKLVLLPTLPSDAFVELLEDVRGARVEFRVPQRGEKAVLLQTVSANAAQTLEQHKLRRAQDLATRNQALEEIQEALALEASPLRIECFDVSHLQGTEIVASMVVFEDGIPRKSQYRRFVIKGQDGSDDVRAMHEVLTRRLNRLAQESEETDDLGAKRFSYRPSLIVVDGGVPQVAAAQRALTECGYADIAVCGLAKRLEEVWLPDEEYPVILPRNSEGLFLLQRLRDEAHRFAITHHRARRSKSMVSSILEEVPGLGPKKRAAILTQFKSMKRLRAASVEEITNVPGIGPKLAQACFETVRGAGGVNMATGEIIE